MQLRVGPFCYRVQFVDGYIHHDGQRCLGLCDNDQHVLYVANVVDKAQQIQVLCHEYMEAWLYQFGADLNDDHAALDKEQLCDLCGLAMTQFALDWVHQAGQSFDTDASSPLALHAGGDRPPAPVARHEHADNADPSRRWVVRVFEPDRPPPHTPHDAAVVAQL